MISGKCAYFPKWVKLFRDLFSGKAPAMSGARHVSWAGTRILIFNIAAIEWKNLSSF